MRLKTGQNNSANPVIAKRSDKIGILISGRSRFRKLLPTIEFAAQAVGQIIILALKMIPKTFVNNDRLPNAGRLSKAV